MNCKQNSHKIERRKCPKGGLITKPFFSESAELHTYAVVVSLDDLQEEGGAVLHGLGEDL